MAVNTLTALVHLMLLVACSPALDQQGYWPQRVLLTNDDGIEDAGLRAMAEAFASVTETHVVAPLENRSGSTNYISAIARRGLEVEHRDLQEGVDAYAVDGYPADAVVFALRGLLVDRLPDLVISGVNGGPNLSDDWNLSGTIGAAQMAAFLGVPAIAVSGYLENDPETLAVICDWVVHLARTPLVREMPRGSYLTVSVPRVPASEITGVEIVRRAPRPWTIQLEPDTTTAASPGRQRWGLRFAPRQTSPGVGTDLQAYSQNRIAIVPMRVDEHDYGQLERLLTSAPELPAWMPPGRSR